MPKYYLYGAGWCGEEMDITVSDDAYSFHYMARPEMKKSNSPFDRTPDFESNEFTILKVWDGESIVDRIGLCLSGDSYSRPEELQRKINALLPQETEAANSGNNELQQALSAEIMRLEALKKRI